MLRVKQRNESSGSGSSTVEGHDPNIAANLSNLSTTPTFSNLAHASARVVHRAPTAADAAGTADDVQAPHESSPNGDNAAQVESSPGPFYSQPVSLSTFSFSRMPMMPPSRMQPVANAAEIASGVLAADDRAASLSKPAYSSYNSQLFLPRVAPTDSHGAPGNAANRSWTNFMFGRGSSLTGTATDNTAATDLGMASSRADATGTSDQLTWGAASVRGKRGCVFIICRIESTDKKPYNYLIAHAFVVSTILPNKQAKRGKRHVETAHVAKSTTHTTTNKKRF